jgi:hypothetical protein
MGFRGESKSSLGPRGKIGPDANKLFAELSTFIITTVFCRVPRDFTTLPRNFTPQSDNYSPRSDNFCPRSRDLGTRTRSFMTRPDNFSPRSRGFCPRTPSLSPRSRDFSPRSRSFMTRPDNFSARSDNFMTRSRSFSALSGSLASLFAATLAQGATTPRAEAWQRDARRPRRLSIGRAERRCSGRDVSSVSPATIPGRHANPQATMRILKRMGSVRLGSRASRILLRDHKGQDYTDGDADAHTDCQVVH